MLDTTHDNHGGVRRRRECENCHQRFSTYERPILATPLIIKHDGTREEFDREKLDTRHPHRLRQAPGLRRRHRTPGRRDRKLAAAHGPLRGAPPASSGDMVVEGLKELDQIAYIRYAIVYLHLDDLRAIRQEIDRLLSKVKETKDI